MEYSCAKVSRTFLTAGAAAGTVARSLSAYDMEISDVTYGKAKRYVTQDGPPLWMGGNAG